MKGIDAAVQARTKRQPYRCYLVRCRLEEGAGLDGEPAWRFTVQQAGPDSARRPFACLHDVVAHIDAELASCALAQKPTGSQKEKRS